MHNVYKTEKSAVSVKGLPSWKKTKQKQTKNNPGSVNDSNVAFPDHDGTFDFNYQNYVCFSSGFNNNNYGLEKNTNS